MEQDATASNGAAAARLDTTVAHNARVWNYWLGGKDHYPADRGVGDHVRQMFPGIVEVARADRQFLRRVVTFLAGPAGIRQFLDIGTGLPTAANTHEVAQGVAPESRIVYVDNDPLVLVHARALLTSHPDGVTDYVEADAHDPAAIVAAARSTLDFEQPVAVLLLGLLNFVLDTEHAAAITGELIEAMPAGSYLVITHPTTELGGDANVEAMRFWNENATPPITARTRDEVLSFTHGLPVLDPGVVSCANWRPDGPGADAEIPQYAVVAQKP